MLMISPKHVWTLVVNNNSGNVAYKVRAAALPGLVFVEYYASNLTVGETRAWLRNATIALYPETGDIKLSDIRMAAS